MQVFVRIFASQLERLFVTVDKNENLLQVGFAGDGKESDVLDEVRSSGYDPTLSETVAQPAVDQLREYCAGTRQKFDLPMAPHGTTFQEHVWSELVKIPYGETLSYGELAKRVGKPKGARAVGMANSRNPLAIIIPCHRVIGHKGDITGYAGGVERKESLLALERRAVRAVA